MIQNPFLLNTDCHLIKFILIEAIISLFCCTVVKFLMMFLFRDGIRAASVKLKAFKDINCIPEVWGGQFRS